MNTTLNDVALVLDLIAKEMNKIILDSSSCPKGIIVNKIDTYRNMIIALLREIDAEESHK